MKKGKMGRLNVRGLMDDFMKRKKAVRSEINGS